jgi:hypothetical protein
LNDLPTRYFADLNPDPLFDRKADDNPILIIAGIGDSVAFPGTSAGSLVPPDATRTTP